MCIHGRQPCPQSTCAPIFEPGIAEWWYWFYRHNTVQITKLWRGQEVNYACARTVSLVVVYDCEFTLCLQITLFTIPRRKKKCIRYLPGEGRCPSPVPSDDSALGCPGSPAPQDSPSYLLLPHFPTELLASPAESAPTSPGLSVALSLPAPWAPLGSQQHPSEYTGTATGISDSGSLACIGHVASPRGPSSERRRESPKARGNRPGALLTPPSPDPGQFRGSTTSART